MSQYENFLTSDCVNSLINSSTLIQPNPIQKDFLEFLFLILLDNRYGYSILVSCVLIKKTEYDVNKSFNSC